MPKICALIVRFEPSLGALVRETIEKFERRIAKKRIWQDGNSSVMFLTVNWPDTDDEGETTSAGYSLGDMIRQFKADGASVEVREKVA